MDNGKKIRKYKIKKFKIILKRTNPTPIPISNLNNNDENDIDLLSKKK